MPETSTPEAPPENEQGTNSPDRRSNPNGGRQPRDTESELRRSNPNERGQARENRNQPQDTEAERGRSDPTRNIAEDTNRRVRSQVPGDAMAKPTPWQKARDWTRTPLKKATKVGLFVLNPVVYSSVYALDWMAQRTPGVKHLYSKPREIIRSTADKTMNVLNGAATFLPALPSTVIHEVSDKMSGLDVSKPTTLVGKLIDKVGDVAGLGLNAVKAVIGKTVEVGKKVVPEVGKGIVTIATAPFKMIGAIYSGINKIGGLTGLAGNLIFTAFLATTGHAAISAVLGATSPVLAATYGGAVDTAIQTIRGLIPWL